MKDELGIKIGSILQEKYNGELTADAKKDIQKLKRGEPLDYIIGFTDFLGCKIDLSKKPLIPRVETEFWTEKAINDASNPSTRFARSGQNLRILDIFAGSGCIGISIMRHIPQANVIFIDKEKKFIEQIKINCKLNKIPESRYKIINSDIFNGFNHKSLMFDFIFANPPYIPVSRKNKIQESVLKYEPHSALLAGKDGLFFIRKFLAQAKNFLNPEGTIFMEFDPPQNRSIEAMLKKHGYKKWEFKKDQYGKFRWVAISI